LGNRNAQRPSWTGISPPSTATPTAPEPLQPHRQPV